MQVTSNVHTMIRHCEGLLSIAIGKEVQILVNVKDQQITEEMIRDMVTSSFGISWDKLISRTKKKLIVTARQSYCYLCHRYLDIIDQEVADNIKRDRTSVIDCRQKIAKYLKTKDEFVHRYINTIIMQLDLIPNKSNNFLK